MKYLSGSLNPLLASITQKFGKSTCAIASRRIWGGNLMEGEARRDRSEERSRELYPYIYIYVYMYECMSEEPLHNKRSVGNTNSWEIRRGFRTCWREKPCF